jgi:hypothetical protein
MKNAIFRRKLVTIAKISDQNIDPRFDLTTHTLHYAHKLRRSHSRR